MPVYCAAAARLSDVAILCGEVRAAESFDLSQLNDVLTNVKGKSNNRLSLNHEQYQFHMLSDDTVVMVCVCDEKFPRKVAFTLLDEMKKQFLRMYIEPVHTLSSSICNQFRDPLKELMDKHSENDGNAKVREIKGALEDVKGIMVQSIDKVIERGSKIDTIVERSEELDTAAEGFRKSARAVKQKVWWQNIRMKIALAVGLIMLIVIISMVFCGGPNYKSCR